MKHSNSIKTIIIGLVLLISTENTLYSQGIGLSGKRLSAFYNIDYAGDYYPFLFREFFGEKAHEYYNVLEDNEPSRFKGSFNLRHTIDLGYAWQRNISVNAALSYYRNGFGDEDNFSRNYHSLKYSIGLRYFTHKSGAIAPIGNYWGFYLFHNRYAIHYRGKSSIYGDDHIKNESDETRTGLSVSFGKQSVLYRKVLFNVSIQADIPVHSGTSRIFYDSGIDRFTRKILIENFLRLTIGIGLCPI